MLERIEAMQTELSALFESLRTGSNRLSADLQLLEANLEEVRDAVVPRPRFEPEPAGTTQPAVAREPEPHDVFAAAGAVEPHGAVEPQNGADDTEGARLIALNMALNGTPREEIDRHLAENFKLADRGALLDEVYASVEG